MGVAHAAHPDVTAIAQCLVCGDTTWTLPKQYHTHIRTSGMHTTERWETGHDELTDKQSPSFT